MRIKAVLGAVAAVASTLMLSAGAASAATPDLPGDFNGDGLADVAQFDGATARWNVGINTGFGTLKSTTWSTFPSTSGWQAFLPGDFDGNGSTDVASYNADDKSWWIGLSTGTSFTQAQWGTVPSPYVLSGFFAGDFTGDGKTDISSFDAKISRRWVGVSTGSNLNHAPWESFSSKSGWDAFVPGDYNADGRVDVASFNSIPATVWVGLSSGSLFPGHTQWAALSPRTGWRDFLAGDFNADGRADLAAFNADSSSLSVGLSIGSDFDFTQWDALTQRSDWKAFTPGDFNADGKTDIAAFSPGDSSWWVALSSGSGFQTSQWGTLPAGSSWGAFVPGDFNADGRTDVASFNSGDSTWWIGLSDGGAFTHSQWTTPAAAAAAPPPTPGETANLAPVSGTVTVQPPDAETFTLTQPEQVPTGSKVDMTEGAAELVTATTDGGTQSGTFRGGFITIEQGANTDLVTLELGGPPDMDHNIIRRVKGNANGKYTSVAGNGAASTRGTIWTLFETRSGATGVKVFRGSVRFRDFVRKRTTIVRAGETAYARPRRSR